MPAKLPFTKDMLDRMVDTKIGLIPSGPTQPQANPIAEKLKQAATRIRGNGNGLSVS